MSEPQPQGQPQSDAPPAQCSAANGAGESTGSALVDAFLAELDQRLKPEDKRQPPDSKERIQKMRPALELLCRNNPAVAEAIMREWAAKNGFELEEPPNNGLDG